VGEMRKFRVHVKSVQEATFELPEEAYEEADGVKVTVEKIMEMEEYNVKSDPTYFSFNDNSTEHVTIDVKEIK
jgi:hypothetical protein